MGIELSINGGGFLFKKAILDAGLNLLFEMLQLNITAATAEDRPKIVSVQERRMSMMSLNNRGLVVFEGYRAGLRDEVVSVQFVTVSAGWSFLLRRVRHRSCAESP